MPVEVPPDLAHAPPRDGRSEIAKFLDMRLVQPAPGRDLGVQLQREQGPAEAVGVRQAGQGDGHGGAPDVEPPTSPRRPVGRFPRSHHSTRAD